MFGKDDDDNKYWGYEVGSTSWGINNSSDNGSWHFQSDWGSSDNKGSGHWGTVGSNGTKTSNSWNYEPIGGGLNRGLGDGPKNFYSQDSNSLKSNSWYGSGSGSGAPQNHWTVEGESHYQDLMNQKNSFHASSGNWSWKNMNDLNEMNGKIGDYNFARDSKHAYGTWSSPSWGYSASPTKTSSSWAFSSPSSNSNWGSGGTKDSVYTPVPLRKKNWGT